MNERIMTADYHIPVKTLDLGNGVSKILPAANQTTPDEAPDHTLRVLILGNGVETGDGFRVAGRNYKEIFSLFDHAPEVTYSSRDGRFQYHSKSGRFICLEDMVHFVYGNQTFCLQEAVQRMPSAVLTISSGGCSSRIRLDQLKDNARFYYPQLTSEQILSGMKPENCRGANTTAGFLRTGETPDTWRLTFVIGQTNWNDLNASLLQELLPGGASLTLYYLPEERKAQNILFIGPLGGILGETVLPFVPSPKGTLTELCAEEGSLVRFNLDNMDLLNSARMYYLFSLDDTPCASPSPVNGFVYNTRIPLYFGNGSNYPNGLILPKASEHRCMNIRILTAGAECPETEIQEFKINITPSLKKEV